MWRVLEKIGPIGRIRKTVGVLRDSRTPTWAKGLFLTLAALYAVSPIDLIPDFIPVAGWIDDLVVVPLLIWLATRFAPRLVHRRHRRTGSEERGE